MAGKLYNVLIDPLLSKVHGKAASLVPMGSGVIDIACGNGTLAVKMASRAEHVTGIDLSPDMLSFAKKRVLDKKIRNIEFYEMNAEDLHAFSDSQFDVASISMAIHQFSPETAEHVLHEMKRIAKNIIILDYRCPLPGGIYGSITRFIERLAGEEHNRNFKSFLNYGGIQAISTKCGLHAALPKLHGSVFEIVYLEKVAT